MSLIKGEHVHPDRIARSYDNFTRTDDGVHIIFEDVYDGNERNELFEGDMQTVPSDDRELSSWVTIVTYLDEGIHKGNIYADVVYIANPNIRLTIRIKAMVTGVNFGSSR